MEEQKDQIISIKTVGGDLLTGVYEKTCKIHGRDTHVFYCDDLKYNVPVIQCDWWALGDKSSKEVELLNGKKMKQQAREVLVEHLNSTKEKSKQEEDVVRQPAPEPENPEKIKAFLDRVKDEKKVSLQESIRNIANHQQSLTEHTPDTEIIQPEGSDIKRQSRAPISRVDDDEDY